VLATSVGACPAKRDINTAPNAVRTRISKETVYLIFKAPWQRRGPAPDSELFRYWFGSDNPGPKDGRVIS